MANRCYNTVDISGPTDDVMYVKKAIKRTSFFNNIRRLPAKKKDDRYDRRIANRGTKRDVHKNDIYVDEFTEGKNSRSELSLAFDTARSPPEELFNYLAKKKPKLHIELRYSELGMCFSGTITWEAGEKINYSHYEDSYFGEGKLCPDCNCTYDPDDECMRDEELPHLCIDCADEERKHLLTSK